MELVVHSSSSFSLSEKKEEDEDETEEDNDEESDARCFLRVAWVLPPLCLAPILLPPFCSFSLVD